MGGERHARGQTAAEARQARSVGSREIARPVALRVSAPVIDSAKTETAPEMTAIANSPSDVAPKSRP